MDLTYQSSTQIYVVRACYNDDATDLVAIGGEHSVEVLQIVRYIFLFWSSGSRTDLVPCVQKSTECVPLASFHVGSRITALAWSSQTTSPIAGDDWFLESVLCRVSVSSEPSDPFPQD
jgi:hypothetical protein